MIGLAKVGDCAQISNSILGRKGVVESAYQNPTHIESTSVIGNAVNIKEGCRLVRTRVSPGLTIPPLMKYVNKFLQAMKILQLAELTG
ncbi:MAG: hypothetical protein ACUVTD_02695 [Nitrososphaerales archaeon]